MSSINDVRKEIYGMMYSGWGGASPETQLVFDSQNYSVSAGTAYTSVSVRHFASTRRTIGAKGSGCSKFTRYGSVFVSIYTPSTASFGQKERDRLSQLAIDILEGRSIPNIDGGELKGATPREVGVVDDSGMYLVVVEVELEYNETS